MTNSRVEYALTSKNVARTFGRDSAGLVHRLIQKRFDGGSGLMLVTACGNKNWDHIQRLEAAPNCVRCLCTP